MSWEEQRSVTSAERPSQPSGERRSGCVARPTVRDMVLADWHLLIEAVFAGIGAEISVASSRPERSWLHARALSLLVPDRISDDLNFRRTRHRNRRRGARSEKSPCTDSDRFPSHQLKGKPG